MLSLRLIYVNIQGLRLHRLPFPLPAKTPLPCPKSFQEPPSHRPTRPRPQLHRSLFSVPSTASAENSFWSSIEHWISYRGEGEHLHDSQSLPGESLTILDSRTDGAYIVRCKDGKDLPLQAARKFKLNAEAGKQCFVKRYVSTSVDMGHEKLTSVPQLCSVSTKRYSHYRKDSPYLEPRTPLLCSKCNTTGPYGVTIRLRTTTNAL
jgi:hypothetical protein